MNDIIILKRKETVEYIPEKLNIDEFIEKIRMVTYLSSGDVQFHIFDDLCNRIAPVHSVWLKGDPSILVNNENLKSLLTNDVNALKNTNIEAYKKWFKNIKTFLIEKDLKI